METWYKTKSRWPEPKVTPVQVEKSTEKSVWINGRRNAIVNEYATYFRTEEAAWRYLRNAFENRIERAKIDLQRYRTALEQVDAALRKLSAC